MNQPAINHSPSDFPAPDPAPDLETLSPAELIQRRRELRHQRRVRGFQAVWRVLAIGAIAGGVVWLTTLPIWVLRSPEQVTISGNRYLSEAAIRSLLNLKYPQSLVRLKPEELVQILEAHSPIAQAIVTRRLDPPGLTIVVWERHPVAQTVASPAPTRVPPEQRLLPAGLIDASGVWMPLESYAALESDLELPNLKVLGMQESQRDQWPALYQTLLSSGLKVTEIDWRHPGNLILKTELGVAHFGPYSYRFPQQLEVLKRMQSLPKKVKTSQISYIDLRNPEVPVLQMQPTPPPTGTPPSPP
ncbi:cell division protein FtsQ/DivIB [Trichothermofontia sp.]